MEILKDEKVKIKLVGEMDFPQFDLTQYIGKKEKISDVSICKGSFGFYLKLTSSVVDVLKGKEPKEIRATKILGLYTDTEGKTGWTKTGKLAEYLSVKGVSTPEQLLNKEVRLQIETKDGKSFLTFV